MDVTPDDKVLLNAMYVGINVQNILYGIELLLYLKTVYALLNHPGERTKADVFYVLFSTVMLLMVTIWISMQGVFGQKMWILNPDFPGGPDGYRVANIWDWYMDTATLAAVLLQLMTDGLMVYRCWAIWQSPRVITIPLILWTGTFVLGILSVWSATVSRGLYLHAIVAQIGLAYYTVSIALCMMLTCMICYHLLRYGKLMEEHLGQEYASTYFAVFALIVESILPCTLSGIAFLISLGMKSEIEVAFGDVYVLMTCISPQMLILRVATRLWADDVNRKPPSTVKFSPLEGITSVFKVEGPSGSASKGNECVV